MTNDVPLPPDPDGRTRAEESRAEELYDLYLEGALEGDTREPRDFLTDHGFGPGPLHDQLVDRLRQIRGLAGEGRAERPAVEGLPFERLGDFRLIEPLGAGAMGVVYLAEQTSLGRLVALKVLRDELAATPDAQRRFDREAHALASIQHPGVVRLVGFGRDHGVRYLAMELVRGRSLAEEIAARRRLPPAEAARLGVDLAEACARVHGAGILHRDIKPSNVRVQEDGRAVLLDLGLARESGLGSQRRSAGFVGSLGYAAPEQVRGNVELDGRADVYSIGATLWHALAGRPPFGGEEIEPLLHAILDADLPPLRRVAPDVPRDLATVVEHAMRREPERRYASAHDLAADLRAVLALRPIAARPPGPLERLVKWTRRDPVAAGAVGVALVATLLLLGLLRWQAVERRAEVGVRARAMLADARTAIEAFRTEREAMATLDGELSALAVELEHGHMFDADRRRYFELLDEVEASRRERLATGFVVADAMSRALQLEPELVEEAIVLRRDLLREQWQDALAGGRVDEQRLIEQELRALEADGGEPLLPSLPLAIELAPGARAWLFRLRELSDLRPGHGHRQVPVPVAVSGRPALADGSPTPPPGTWVLRPARAEAGVEPLDRVLAVRGEGIEGGPFVRAAPAGSPLAPGDRVLRVRGEPVRDARGVALLVTNELGLHRRRALADDSVEYERDGRVRLAPVKALAEVDLVTPAEWLARDGGPATVLRDGERLELDLPPGIDWRTSGFVLAPLWANAIPASTELWLPPGHYVLLAHAPGCAPLRAHVSLEPGAAIGAVRLEPRWSGFAPPGYRHLAAPQQEFWLSEFELTVGEYEAYLADPEVRARTAAARAAGERGPVPLSVERPGARDLDWQVDADGRARLADGVDRRLALVGISKRDADAFVDWYRRRGGPPGFVGGGRFGLGAEGIRTIAGCQRADRRFAYGTRFDPQAGNTCFSRPVADVEPVGSYPLDESPLGVYDLCGNAAEWLDGYFDRSRRAWHAAGGSWGQAPASVNRTLGGLGHRIDEATDETGLRLAWWPDAPDAPAVDEEGAR